MNSVWTYVYTSHNTIWYSGTHFNSLYHPLHYWNCIHHVIRFQSTLYYLYLPGIVFGTILLSSLVLCCEHVFLYFCIMAALPSFLQLLKNVVNIAHSCMIFLVYLFNLVAYGYSGILIVWSRRREYIYTFWGCRSWQMLMPVLLTNINHLLHGVDEWLV